LAHEVGSTANSYAILAKLATGGMAEIFLARNASGAGIERYVVLKRVLRHKANDVTFVQMFLDEARLAAQLQHPNIAQVYDTGVLGDSYFFTMEYVHGETVREILHKTHAQKSAIPISAALTVGAAAAAGLHHAHERKGFDGKPLGIVHRDVSPSNLMVSFEGNVKVVDFGVAKATQRRTETQAGTVKGKIAYLSPEQCRGRLIDRRSDLFSLGIVMWEMLVGDRLFRNGTDFETMEAIVQTTPPPPSSRRADIPPEVDEIIGKMLARDREQRYQTADDVLDAIERVAVKVGVSLSTSALGRFVRELFGSRPEPWLEMQQRDVPPEIVTVTAAPAIGESIETSPSADQASEQVIDSQLAALPGLPSRSIARTPTPLPFLSGLTPTPTPTPLPEPAPASASFQQYPSTGSYSSVDSAPPLVGSKRSRAIWLAVAGGAVAVGLLAVFVLHGGGGSGERDVPAAAAPAPAQPARVEQPPPAPPVEAAKPEAPAHARPVAAPAAKVAPPAPEVAKPPPPEVAKPVPAEVAKPAPKVEPVKTVAAPKPEPVKVETPAPKPEPAKIDPPGAKLDWSKAKQKKPKTDCEIDPMSCRR
jgi:serine/threonine protein kinase